MNKYLLNISKKLISHDTVSFKSNNECAALIAGELESMGFNVFIENFNDNGQLKQQVIASIGPATTDGIILSGHIDTVPWETQKGWTKDALKLSIEDGNVYGRGSCDMKLFIAHCLTALKETDLSRLVKPIVCIFTADEEIGCLGAKRIVKKLDTILDHIPLPKIAIIGEPTSFNIINTHKGAVFFDVLIKGSAGHSSRPDLGKNAIESLGIIIDLINQQNQKFKDNLDSEVRKIYPEFPYNHLHMAVISGGSALNMIPDLVKLSVSYRPFPTDPLLMVLDIFKDEIAKLKNESIKIDNVFTTPGLNISKDTKYENILKEITSKDTQSVSFATDAGYLSQADINCYICGPGSIDQAHRPDEFMPLSDFVSGVNFVKAIINQQMKRN